MKLQEILDEIAEKYPHDMSNDSVIRKINLVQNELFRTTFLVKTMAMYNIQKDVFAYTLPFPRTSLSSVIVDGRPYNYQDSKRESNNPFYYFVGDKGLGINPTPDKDIESGLALFYTKSPKQLTDVDKTVVPELDPDFHLLLVYGALAQITESFNDVAMINNFTNKYNGLIQEFQKANDETPDYPVIEDVMGVW